MLSMRMSALSVAPVLPYVLSEHLLRNNEIEINPKAVVVIAFGFIFVI